MTSEKRDRQPAIPTAGWPDTRDTLHSYTVFAGPGVPWSLVRR